MAYPVIFTPSALQDLIEAKNFYGQVDLSLGKYCSDSLILEAEKLAFFAGIHPQKYGYYRFLAKTFPYSIYYNIRDHQVIVSAIIDNRMNPESILNKLNHC
ncbi:MAG: type II toxin-antitoxin system RelE/ParE family toxin [Hydrogenovibrio sp.]|uniref:type II toxin-antitoxin system RelE/ParE family toxin n=1 Tax=Hydrogenovibrio sp. TaxID=2065821 RepID=UPI00287056E5|nr:type II toxin-antitoxin system RelE/ParE family toxin [Hydrogenovibrio sp.]MDR9500037.1 type II toxin-antitoxin system RelE/ParE family toxin [Hydrogenovibrio sp.]